MRLLTLLKTLLGRFNEFLAVKGTRAFGTMWAFYLFFVWGLLAFVPQLARFKDAILLISSAWIQLWALPLLAVGNVVLGRASQEQASEDHDAIMSEMAEIKAIHSELRELIQNGNEVLTELHKMHQQPKE